ncbi:MAG TPA: GLUG motif-containing protein [Wenzhouxiangella sp.]
MFANGMVLPKSIGLSLALIVLGFLALTSASAQTTCPGGEAGDSADPCKISTWSDFQAIQNNTTLIYELTQNLEANDAPANFTPTDRFGGTFDGKGFSISGLKINATVSSGTGYFGLFGQFHQPVTIKNLTVINPEITVSSDDGTTVRAGAIVGSNSSSGFTSTFDNVSVVNGSIEASGTGKTELGGLIGFSAQSLVITDSNSSAEIVSAGSGSGTVGGGLVGHAFNTFEVTDSSATGDVTGTFEAGGLIGKVAPTNSAPATISSSYATGAVGAGGDTGKTHRISAGGLVGLLTVRRNSSFVAPPINITDSYATGDVTRLGSSFVGPENGFGGLIGRFIGDSNAPRSTFQRVFASGDVTVENVTNGLNGVGGLIGFIFGNTEILVEDAYATGAVNTPTQFMESGGLVGRISDNTLSKPQAFNRVYAVGPITKGSGLASYAGGLLGRSLNTTPTFTSAYWDTQATGMTDSVGFGTAVGTGLTQAQMLGTAAETNMNGFDFSGSGQWKSVVTGDPAEAGEDKYPILSAAVLNTQTSQAAQLAAVKPRETSDPVAVALVTNYDGTGTAPTADDYAKASVTGVVSGNVDAINTAVAAADIADGDTAALQVLVTAYVAVLDAAGDASAAGSLTAQQYADIGVDVDAPAVPLLNNGIAIAAPTDINTIDKLQDKAAIADGFADFVAGTGGASDPTADDYEALGFTVVDANVPSYNSSIEETQPTSNTVQKVTGIIAAYNKIIAGNDLTQTEFADLGVTINAGLSLVNSVAQEENTDIAAVEDLQAIALAAERVLSVAGGTTVTPALAVADFQAVGVVGVTASNLSKAVENLEKADPTQLTSVDNLQQALGDLADPQAVATLVGLEDSTTPPGADVYLAAGITGVDADNLAAYASALVAKDIDDGDTTAVQALVDGFNAIIDAAGTSGAASLSGTSYAAVGVDVADNAAVLSLLNSGVGATSSSAAVNTTGKLQAMADAAERIVDTATSGSDAGLTVTDFEVLGVSGIASFKLAGASDAVAKAEPSEVSTVAGLLAVLAEVIAATLPVPTLSTWALLALALMFMMLSATIIPRMQGRQ